MRTLLALLLLFSPLFSLDRGLRKVMEKEQRVALLIGNSEYSRSNYFDDLKNPVRDVKAISKKLKKLGFRVVEGYNLSNIELEDKLSRFYSLLKSENSGVGLLYFAGHGIEVNGINYLIPSDISARSERYIPYRSTPLNPIVEEMRSTGKRLNVVMLDACRENPFSDGRNGRSGGLANFSASGTFIAYSAESGKIADDGNGKNSPFAKSLLKHIETPQTIEQLFKKVRTDVYRETRGEQTPATYNLIQGDFFFKLPNQRKVLEYGSTAQNTTFTYENEKRDEFFLDIKTVSGAKIEVNGDSFKNGSLLKKGRYSLQISKSGYKTKKLKVDLNQDTTLKVTLQKSKVSLTVKPKPADSRVYITNIRPKYRDGILLNRGKYSLKVVRSGYYTKRLTVDLQSDSVFDIALDKIGDSSTVVGMTTVKTVSSSRVEKSNGYKPKWDKRIYRGERSYSKFSRNLVKDNFTNLVWTKNSSSNSMNWRSAKSYCEDLRVDGYSDFRLPTEKELYYLADRSRRSPAVDSSYFNIKSKWHWSITKYNNNSSESWVVDFNDGSANWDHQTSSSYAVCVRDSSTGSE